MEAIIGTLIAVIAVVGLAHSFGVGRGLITRYEVARVALGAAQSQMEALSVLPLYDSDLAPNSAHDVPFTVQGEPVGSTHWRITPSGETPDMNQVTVVVNWGDGADADSVKLTRLFLKP